MWPVEQHPITGEHRQRLAVLQNGCELTHDDYSSCYSATAFDFQTAKSSTRKYELYRTNKAEYSNCARGEDTDNFHGNSASFGDQSNVTKCKWKGSTKTKRFMQPVPLWDPQLVADVASAMNGTVWDQFDNRVGYAAASLLTALAPCLTSASNERQLQQRD